MSTMPPSRARCWNWPCACWDCGHAWCGWLPPTGASTVLHAAAVIPWNPKRQKQRDGLPPTWTAEELGRRSSIERFFSRVMVFFRLQRPPVSGWSAVETRVALTYAAVWVVAIAAWQAGRPDLIRSPRLVLAHVWEGVEL